MTQKELLYFEDAIGHEQNIISIIEESLNNIDDEEIITFMNDELTKHNVTCNNLISVLEELQNG